jgi:hypothetical protein
LLYSIQLMATSCLTRFLSGRHLHNRGLHHTHAVAFRVEDET